MGTEFPYLANKSAQAESGSNKGEAETKSLSDHEWTEPRALLPAVAKKRFSRSY
jgi:hypothetical protein